MKIFHDGKIWVTFMYTNSAYWKKKCMSGINESVYIFEIQILIISKIDSKFQFLKMHLLKNASKVKTLQAFFFFFQSRRGL